MKSQVNFFSSPGIGAERINMQKEKYSIFVKKNCTILKVYIKKMVKIHGLLNSSTLVACTAQKNEVFH